MSFRTVVLFPTMADMIGGVVWGQPALLDGITVQGDLTIPRYYKYDDTSTATHDGVNVIQTSDVAPGDPGRWLIQQLVNVPTVKKSEVMSGTTSGSGIVNFSFTKTYGAAPNVNATIPNQTATNQYVRVTSITATGCTVTAWAFTSLLGVIQLTPVNVASLPVEILVTEK